MGRWRKAPKWARRLVHTAAACACAALLFMLFLFIYGRFSTAAYTEEAAIVFGAGLRGEEPSLSLEMRLEQALDYAAKNPRALLVVSGGQGANEVIPEAEAMARWLIAHGVDASRIIQEPRSANTRENIANSKTLLDAWFGRPYTVALITNDFHLFRAGQYARLAGLTATRLPAKTPFPASAYWYLRECVAAAKLAVYAMGGPAW